VAFKDQILKDLDTVFLNVDEFAELHRIEGKKIPVVMDDNLLQKLKQGQILGLVEADILLFGKESDFPKNLNPGRLLNVDGRELILEKAGKSMGMVEVALRQNATM
jgi:hypothetical protein